MKSFLKEYAILIGILAGGLLLRLVHINWGLPEVYEEATPLTIAWKFWSAGDFNPHFFNYPALTFYIQYAVQAIQYFIGHLIGIYSNFTDFGATSASLVITARIVSVVFDTGTIIVVYLLGRKVAGHRVALAAAAILALNPLHIEEAHLIQVDTPLTFFSMMALFFILKTIDTPTLKWYLISGIFIGLAAASKYTGAFLLLTLLVAFGLRFKSFPTALKHWNDSSIMAGVISSGVVFLICNPYIMLDFNNFQNDFAFEHAHVTTGHLGVVSSRSTIGYYLGDVLGNYFGWVLIALFIFSAILIFKKREKYNITLISFPIVYLFIVSSWQMRAERYILPIFPVLILIGTIGIAKCLNWPSEFGRKKGGKTIFSSIQSRLALGGIVGALAIIQPTMHTYAYLKSLGLSDTRTLTKQWIVNHIPKGSTIATGPYGIDFPPDQYTTLNIPFLAFESERVAPFYDARWYEDMDVVITSDYDYGRYKQEPEKYRDFLPYYDTLKSRWKLLYEMVPGQNETGPSFWLYSLPDSLKHSTFDSTLFDRLAASPESSRISNFLKDLDEILLMKKQYPKSIQLMREILAVEEGNIQLRNQLAGTLIAMGDYAEGLKQLGYSIKMDPDQPMVYALGGRTLLRLNSLKEAEQALFKANSLDPSIHSVYDDLIELYTQQNDPDKLSRVMSKYISILPVNSEKRNELQNRLKEIPSGKR